MRDLFFSWNNMIRLNSCGQMICVGKKTIRDKWWQCHFDLDRGLKGIKWDIFFSMLKILLPDNSLCNSDEKNDRKLSDHILKSEIGLLLTRPFSQCYWSIRAFVSFHNYFHWTRSAFTLISPSDFILFVYKMQYSFKYRLCAHEHHVRDCIPVRWTLNAKANHNSHQWRSFCV